MYVLQELLQVRRGTVHVGWRYLLPWEVGGGAGRREVWGRKTKLQCSLLILHN